MKNQKSLTNKGFSLVELIIVVAIMAVLIGVLAPQYLRYVEKSRLQKDNTSIAEIADCIKMMSAEETLVDKFSTSATTPTKFSFTSGAFTGSGVDELDAELKATIGDWTTKPIKLSSNTYGKTANLDIEVVVDPDTKVMTVQCKKWKETVGTKDEDATTKIF